MESKAEDGLSIGTRFDQTPDEPKPEASEEPSEVEALREKLSGLEEAHRAEVEGLKTQSKELSDRLAKLQDSFLDNISNRASVTPPEPPEESLELSDEGSAIVRKLTRELEALKTQMQTRASEVETSALTKAAARAEAAQIKAENPELWEILRPLAADIADKMPSLSVRECWNKAVEQFQPYQEAKVKVDSEREKEAKKISKSERPSGPKGGEKPLTARSAFEQAWAEAGLD